MCFLFASVPPARILVPEHVEQSIRWRRDLSPHAANILWTGADDASKRPHPADAINLAIEGTEHVIDGCDLLCHNGSILCTGKAALSTYLIDILRMVCYVLNIEIETI